jgi:serine/threonine-protein kinase
LAGLSNPADCERISEGWSLSTQPEQPGGSEPKSSQGPSLARVQEVFFEVASAPAKEREGAMRRLCGGDSALEREVRSLVASAAKAGSFLEQPALGKQVGGIGQVLERAEPLDPLIGATVGSFTVERRIASGGMGTVYAATRSDGQFQQRVAIKVVKRGMDSEEILRRFRLERQTLAGLDHPNIARLLDGGMTPDGRPFVVMEFIDGKPIDVYCDEQRLGLRERLRLFRDVCAGVQHAHQNLVIHRDLKPSNILVTPQGVPKLLDFGIAKVITGGTADLRASVTADTERRLTPEYASPEQIEGTPLTTASDVYSLGVVLYELLTGTRPYYFNLKTSEEVRRVVCTLMPLPPSQAVTVKASRLRTDSPSRPGSRGAPSVGPQTPAPGTITAPAEGAGAPAVDVPKTRGVSTTRLRSLLRGDLDVVVLMALRKEPQRRYMSAEQFSEDVESYLRGLPVRARRDTLGYRASKFVRRHAVSVTLTAAAVALLAGTTVMLYRQSQELQRQRVDLIAANQQLDEKNRRLDESRQFLVAANQRLDENNRRLNESRRFLRTVIGGAGTSNAGPSATLGEVLKDAADALRTARPADPLTLAAAEEEVGRALMSLGVLDQAGPLLTDADRLYSALPAGSDQRMDSALNLGELAFYQGKYPEAEKAFRELLAAERAGKSGGAATPRESSILNNLGASVRLLGRADEAITIQREALAATIAAYGAQSLEAAETRNNLASAMFQHGDLADAIEQYTQALAARRAQLRADHPLVVRCESNLGLAQLRAGKADEAIALLTESANAWEAAFGPEHPGRVATMTSLSQALRKQGKQQEALVWLRKTLDWQRAHGAAAVPVAATEANIAITLGEQGKDAEAIETLARVLPSLRADKGYAAITKAAGEALAAAYERAGRGDDARGVREGLK